MAPIPSAGTSVRTWCSYPDSHGLSYYFVQILREDAITVGMGKQRYGYSWTSHQRDLTSATPLSVAPDEIRSSFATLLHLNIRNPHPFVQ